jgi:hypothetical protein
MKFIMTYSADFDVLQSISNNFSSLYTVYEQGRTQCTNKNDNIERNQNDS